MLGCDEVAVERVTIDNPLDGPNTDGLDIDCCSNVHVNDCTITAGDDCVAVKSDGARMGTEKPCENIRVSRCRLTSTACAVRIGYEGDAPIRNCRFSDLSIQDTDIGIDIVSVMPEHLPVGMAIDKGARIQDIDCRDIAMQNVRRAIFIWLGKETDRPFSGEIRNVSMENIRASARGGSYIGGIPGQPVENIRLDKVHFEIIGPGEIASDLSGPSVWGTQMPPYGLLLRNARNIELLDVTFDRSRAGGGWQGELIVQDVDGYALTGE
jgi:polygalacturonase